MKTREFKHPNMINFECPLCNTNKDLPVVLVPIPGTEKDNICEAQQIHSECMKTFCKMNDIEFEIIN